MANVNAFESDVKVIPGLLAGEDLSSYQYCAVKLSSGSVVHCSTLGEFTIGIQQDAPDTSGDPVTVAYGGISRVKLEGNVSQQNRLVANTTTGKLVAQVDPDEAVIAIALSDGVSGDIIPAIVALGTALNSAVAERALANTKFWIGNASGEAAAYALSGDATCTAGGVVSVTGLTLGSDAQGDMLVRGASAYARLAIGTAGQILVVNSGATSPAWVSMSGDATIASTGAITVADVTVGSDAQGDMLIRGASAYTRLGIGTAGQMLLVNAGATAPAWVSMSGDATIASTGAITVADVTVGSDAQGDMLVRGASAYARLAIGSAGQILVVNAGATSPAWVSMSGDATIASTGAVTVADVTVGSDAQGDMLVRGAAAYARLAIGTAGQILVVNAGATSPAWVSLSGDATITDAGVITVADVTVGSDAIGDIHYKSSATVTARLGISGGGKKLTINGGGTAPVWDNNKIVKLNLTGMSTADDPFCEEADYTARSGATGVAHIARIPDGTILGYAPCGAGQTLDPVGETNALDIACDQTDNEGVEYFFGMYGADGRLMSVGFDAAFYMLVALNIQTINGCDDLFVGFRKWEAFNADVEAYDTYFGLGVNTGASPADIKVRNELNGAGADNTDTTDNLATATTVQFKILVSAGGVATVQHDIATPGTLAAPTATKAFTFDNGDQLVPIIRFLHANAAQAGQILLSNFEVGYQ